MHIYISTAIEPRDIDNAELILIDNGIDAAEAPVVLQALGYALLDEELYPDIEYENDFFQFNKKG